MLFYMTFIVRKGPNDSNDTVIRKFQKKTLLENVIQEYRDKQYNKSASEKKQEKRAEKVRKIMRAKRLNS